MKNKCIKCHLDMNELSAAKGDNGAFRNVCKKCRNIQAKNARDRNIIERRIKEIEYLWKIGKYKKYPCIHCGKLCIRNHQKVTCSDKCRILTFIEKTETCWIWKGAKSKGGYGSFCFNGKSGQIAHRAAYVIFLGPIPEDMDVLHTCDRRDCVNPDHFWIGNHSENMKDMVKKGRSRNRHMPKLI